MLPPLPLVPLNLMSGLNMPSWTTLSPSHRDSPSHLYPRTTRARAESEARQCRHCCAPTTWATECAACFPVTPRPQASPSTTCSARLGLRSCKAHFLHYCLLTPHRFHQREGLKGYWKVGRKNILFLFSNPVSKTAVALGSRFLRRSWTQRSAGPRQRSGHPDPRGSAFELLIPPNPTFPFCFPSPRSDTCFLWLPLISK